MKIQILSDIHQEFGITELSFDQAEVLILAGDVNLGTKGVEWMLESLPDIPIIYVLGNHEYYKGSYPKTLHKIQEVASGTNVHVLENEAVTIGNITFHGASLWTDFALLGDPKTYGIICQTQVSDYKYIRRDPSYSRLRSIDTYNIHQISRRWLIESLEAHRGKTNVVVTHHAPSERSLPSRYRGKATSSAYASNLESLIQAYDPVLWVHGHIHVPQRYQIGSTQVICNPHGYIDEPYNGYEKELIIEL